jgi:hypothetical protein
MLDNIYGKLVGIKKPDAIEETISRIKDWCEAEKNIPKRGNKTVITEETKEAKEADETARKARKKLDDYVKKYMNIIDNFNMDLAMKQLEKLNKSEIIDYIKTLTDIFVTEGTDPLYNVDQLNNVISEIYKKYTYMPKYISIYINKFKDLVEIKKNKTPNIAVYKEIFGQIEKMIDEIGGGVEGNSSIKDKLGVARGWIDKSIVTPVVEKLSQIHDVTVKKDKAVTKIAAVWRGKQLRRKINELKEIAEAKLKELKDLSEKDTELISRISKLTSEQQAILKRISESKAKHGMEYPKNRNSRIEIERKLSSAKKAQNKIRQAEAEYKAADNNFTSALSDLETIEDLRNKSQSRLPTQASVESSPKQELPTRNTKFLSTVASVAAQDPLQQRFRKGGRKTPSKKRLPRYTFRKKAPRQSKKKNTSRKNHKIIKSSK